MVKLIWRTDVHMSDRTPQSRTDTWKDTLAGKLYQVGEIARDVGAEAVIDGGDFFDIKSPSRNSHDLVRLVADIHSKYPCPVYANVGNHDCVYGDYSYIDQQPLGVLFSTGVFRRLYDEYEAVFGSPGTKTRPQVRVVGIPYHGTKYDLDRFKNIKKGDEDYLMVVAHVLASKKGGTMFENEDIIKYADLAGLDPDVWCFGHWHKDQGVEEIADGKYVVNVGSLSRGALSMDDMERQPCCIELGFAPSGITITRHDLDILTADKVFDIDGRVRAEARSSMREDFIDSLKETLTSDNHTPLRDVISGMDVPDEVKERAALYLEQA
jgi:DNA repair exonuclease SbcCD nuclease subunit